MIEFLLELIMGIFSLVVSIVLFCYMLMWIALLALPIGIIMAIIYAMTHQ